MDVGERKAQELLAFLIMSLSRLALRCEVDGRLRVMSADGVRLVTLRLPVIEDGVAWVELGGQRWPVVDERARAPALTDHFVFLSQVDSRRVVVVDRVLDLVLSSAPNDADGMQVPR